MKQHILITGGAGFVGSHLCKKLLQENYAITIVDDLSNGKEENIPEGVEFFKINIAKKEELKKIPAHPFQKLIHIAAQASNAISFDDPELDLATNQLGSLNILKFCVQRNITRIIFTSSMSAYGTPQHLPTLETERMLPDSFYAVHKLASEHYMRIFSQQYGINYTIFRLYTTYGHGQNLDNINQGLLSIYLSQIINNDFVLVKGSKDRTRDIIHVSDVVNAIIMSLNNQKSFNKTYNLGTGECIRIEEILDLLTQGLGYNENEFPIRYENGTPGDPFDTLANNTSARKDLNWEPKISPREGIQLTISDYNKTKSNK
ncbi:MAG: NAD-dependent epimerase/dehydratase family protein [bacterium]|nr:NAD-dependent epimerase/dehydratase family protein [bacterium]